MSLATNSLSKNSQCSLLPPLHHLILWAPDQSMAISHVPLGGHGQAEMVKDNPWSWCGNEVSGASHCKVPSVPWLHEALSSPQNQECVL